MTSSACPPETFGRRVALLVARVSLPDVVLDGPADVERLHRSMAQLLLATRPSRIQVAFLFLPSPERRARGVPIVSTDRQNWSHSLAFKVTMALPV